jgi:hypothetical protein
MASYTGTLRKEAGRPYGASGRVVRVSQLSANVYRDPDVTKHEPLVTAPWESRLEVLADRSEQSERWLKVRLPDGNEGFVQRGDVSSDFRPVDIPPASRLQRDFWASPTRGAVFRRLDLTAPGLPR